MGDYQERRCVKYWVRKDFAVELAEALNQELPLYSFGRKNAVDGLKDATAVLSSVYFDGSDFNFYNRRLRRENGAQLLRVRWYNDWKPGSGDAPAKAYVELKTHRSGWVGTGRSTKERFAVDGPGAGGVGAFLAKVFVGESSETEEDGAVDEGLRSRVSTILRENSLAPKVLVTYRRLAFQAGDDTSVRVSLDQELRSYSAGKSGEFWFDYDAGSVTEFPFAILEVKYASSAADAPDLLPTALRDAINRGVMIGAHKFSKYVQSAAMLRSDDVPSLPSWILSEWLRHPTHLGGDAPAALQSKNKVSPLLENPVSPIPNTVCSPPTRNDAKRQNKPVVINMRVEPKTHFANERTFLQWMQTLLTLVIMCVALQQVEAQIAINLQQAFASGAFVDKTSAAADIARVVDWLPSASAVLIFLCLVGIVYAYIMFNVRASRINNRRDGPYYDHRGPTLIVFIIFAAILVNGYHAMELYSQISSLLK